MTDSLLSFGFSGVFTSLLLALIALTVHRSGRAPAVAHLLWLLLLVKLVIPPMVALPIVPWPGVSAGLASTAALDSAPARTSTESAASAFAAGGTHAGDFSAAFDSDAPAPAPAASGPIAPASATPLLPGWLRLAAASAWIAGSALLIGGSIFGMVRFNRRLDAATTPAPEHVQRLAADVAATLRLRRVPTVYASAARLSPMVWWAGREIRIVIPSALIDTPEPGGPLRWILAHELAHLKRRDHLVRWLEWIACSLFWWNPLAWIARRNLRINEEICCDAMVLARFSPNPRTYAVALMQVVEYLATPAFRPPAVASQITGGGILERRFRMIISSDRSPRSPRWLMAAALTAAVGLVPFGMASAQDYDAISKRLKEAVSAGELSSDQAATMMGALKKRESADGTSPADQLQASRRAAEMAKQAANEAQRMAEMAARQAEHDRAAVIKERYDAEMRELARTLAPEEAERRMKALQEQYAAQELPGRLRGAERQLESAQKRIEEAMRSGDLAPEQARRAIEELRSQLGELNAQTQRRTLRERSAQAELEAAMAQIQAKLAAGRLNTEDAKRKIEELMQKQLEIGRALNGEWRVVDGFGRVSERSDRARDRRSDSRTSRDSQWANDAPSSRDARQSQDGWTSRDAQRSGDARSSRDSQRSRDAQSSRDSRRSNDAQQSYNAARDAALNAAQEANRAARESARQANQAAREARESMLRRDRVAERRLAYERDVERIAAEIRNAVQSGWLTLGEAEQKMAELKERAKRANEAMRSGEAKGSAKGSAKATTAEWMRTDGLAEIHAAMRSGAIDPAMAEELMAKIKRAPDSAAKHYRELLEASRK
ncbi:MAG: M56 family metallopeptidase [Phycisphaerales bacterium]